MIIRRALTADHAGILCLANIHHRDNLTAQEQRQGFLSARFSLQQIAGMADDLGIIVAVDGEQVVGFMCASRCERTDHPAIVRQLLDTLPQWRLHGRPLAAQEVFIYGPVCIAAAYRGRGLLRKMYQCLQREVAGRYRAGVAFVAEDNEASLDAHIHGLKMHPLGSFIFAARSYRVLAFEAGDGMRDEV